MVPLAVTAMQGERRPLQMCTQPGIHLASLVIGKTRRGFPRMVPGNPVSYSTTSMSLPRVTKSHGRTLESPRPPAPFDAAAPQSPRHFPPAGLRHTRPRQSPAGHSGPRCCPHPRPRRRAAVQRPSGRTGSGRSEAGRSLPGGPRRNAAGPRRRSPATASPRSVRASPAPGPATARITLSSGRIFTWRDVGLALVLHMHARGVADKREITLTAEPISRNSMARLLTSVSMVRDR